MPHHLSQWALRNVEGIKYYELLTSPNLLLVFFTRKGGVSQNNYESLNLSFEVGDKSSAVEENYKRAKHALRIPTIITLKQTHSAIVLPISYDRIPPDLLEGDAAFTIQLNTGLAVKVADCLPVFIYARDSRCIGIAHCGWQGTASRIAEKLARTMSRRFSIPLTDLRFALGPCICPNCYTVGDDVKTRFTENFPATDKFLTSVQSKTKRTKYRLDIRAANRWLLKGMGLEEVPSLEMCTRENKELFFSARRNKPTGRNLAVIVLRR
ncbi:hypothetical protein CH330_06255 [candidate division WOR-3 bacterium JGI_Cruoil_03_51_56]|uniref:Purine nucleoside phosphorylase n=1 Tax=candidate division WOR-3 bacterium JGI_Cruoil_03_51_56 TaxID=1973747 RepID=A0A235BR20_UNCW3|nr:MAG: hypothetical protein CH330_08010 [candidate division WOR-3 bacterium JGI_Cruoil_03_51_56]OYD15256.1 MAG: hypothetical protein CH330_06255 [candidate division WOR-3 bacterium JGI_Cruoil_03_51_56]